MRKIAHKVSPVHQIARRTAVGRKMMSLSQKLNLARRVRAKVMASKVGRGVVAPQSYLSRSKGARMAASSAARRMAATRAMAAMRRARGY